MLLLIPQRTTFQALFHCAPDFLTAAAFWDMGVSMSSLYLCELFGHFAYSEDLSYHDLLEREAGLLEALEQTLRGHEAAHIDFTPAGDVLRMQCMFAKPDKALFHALCEEIAPLLAKDIEGRLLFVDKDLVRVNFYCLADSTWKEAVLSFPGARAGAAGAQPGLETGAAHSNSR
jgi:hypothetical protein